MNTLLGILSGFFLLSVTELHAQPDTLWTRTFGGAEDEIAASLLAAESGGLVAVGSSNTETGRWQVYVLRLDNDGNVSWSHELGYVNTGDRFGVDVVEDQVFSIRYVVVTYDYFQPSSPSFTRLLYTEGGFNDYLDPPNGSGNVIEAIASASGWRSLVGRRIIGQGIVTQGYLYRYDAYWGGATERLYHLSGYYTGLMDIAAADAEWLAVGWRGLIEQSSNFCLFRLTAEGDIIWTRVYGGTGADTATSVVQTLDGGFAFTGPTDSYGENGDFYLMKVNADGDSLWSQTYGGGGVDKGRKVALTSDGGFVLVGYTESFGAGGDIYVVRTDSVGNELWSGNYGGDDFDTGADIVVTSDGGYAIAGTTASFGNGETDFWVIRLAADELELTDADHRTAGEFVLEQNFPNPFNSETQISFAIPNPAGVSLRVYDTIGRDVKTLLHGEVLSAGTHTVTLNAASLTTGLYFCRLDADDISQTRKMVVLK